MRAKRSVIFRKRRHRRIRMIIFLILVMPVTLILLGYLVASVIVLPSMSG